MMKQNDSNKIGMEPLPVSRNATTLIQSAKANIWSEFQERVNPFQHVLHLALNEAEALSWQTDFPHLLFPSLAKEKAEAVLNWHRHQQTVKEAPSVLALAA